MNIDGKLIDFFLNEDVSCLLRTAAVNKCLRTRISAGQVVSVEVDVATQARAAVAVVAAVCATQADVV